MPPSPSSPVADVRHEVLSVSVDHQGRWGLIHDLIRGTRTGEGLPVPRTGKHMASLDMLDMVFQDGRNHRAEQVWNDHAMVQQLGWV